ncbi:c-type cytochrome [Roseomonas sp. OT10]|uniref:c-type cytochrome n=1 Tax=Roseomonas cutis TaxID=2897332 RepID=UPI001E2EDE4E|nr:c-type cytochrome [Roseomonas sp. OT10]UFN48049.1 c-type cytochrome [Roseomonas sp. OT10]
MRHGAVLALLGALAAPGGAEAADARRGAALAAERNCAACHGERGRSAMPDIPSLAGQQPGFVTIQLVLFREGLRDVPAMQPAVEGLTDAQIEDLAAWAAALPPGPPPDRPRRDAARFAAGAAAAQRGRCGICHTPDYRGQQQVPLLVGQREDYLARTLREYRDGVRVGSDTQMNAALHGVADADLDALAHHLSHLP